MFKHKKQINKQVNKQANRWTNKRDQLPLTTTCKDQWYACFVSWYLSAIFFFFFFFFFLNFCFWLIFCKFLFRWKLHLIASNVGDKANFADVKCILLQHALQKNYRIKAKAAGVLLILSLPSKRKIVWNQMLPICYFSAKKKFRTRHWNDIAARAIIKGVP